jgi:hypothetical protein
MILAITYVLVSTLLVLGAIFFFGRALKNLSHAANKGIGTKASESLLERSPDISTSDPLYQGANREEIIAKLERQFRSSPSSEL